MAVSHATALRTDFANLATGTATTFTAGTNQVLGFYSGTSQSGTIAITNGTAAVTGTGTTFTGLAVGQAVQFAGDTTHAVYTILSIGSNTAMTLTANYAGTTLASSAYVSSPINVAAALSGNTLIASVTALVWAAGSTGVAALTGSTQGTSGSGGIAMFYRRLKSDATTGIEQGLCGTSGADLNMTSTLVIAAGATVSINSGSYTASP